MGDSAKALGLSGDVSRVTTQGRRFSPSRKHTLTGVAVPAGIASLSNIGDAAKKELLKNKNVLQKYYKKEMMN